MIRGVLLDVDGTLVLSNDAHAETWVRAFAEHGYEVDHDTIRSLLGMGADQLIPRVAPELTRYRDPGKAISESRQQLFLKEYAPSLRAAPGSRALVQRIKDEGLLVAIASSAKSEELEVLLKVADVQDLIEIETTGDDADNTKPAPDIVEAAMQKVNMPAEELTMLGDTPYDVESAGKAGVGVIAVRCGGFSDDTFKGALGIYDDPADLLAQYDSSPLGRLSRR